MEARQQHPYAVRLLWHAGFGHLVVCTASHCHVYATSNFNTPHIFDLKEQPQLVLQCGRNFALLDAAAGMQVGIPASCSGRLCSVHPCQGRCKQTGKSGTHIRMSPTTGVAGACMVAQFRLDADHLRRPGC
jgi:ferredoxin